MPGNVLSAIITADGTRFTKTLGQLEAQLKTFEAGLKKAGSIDSFNRLNRAIDATKARMAALKTGFNQLGGASVNATGDLINLGRVVQDAPFGFLGIANNLNPLIEGFARTSKAAGGFGGGLKALGKSLVGGGGLALGVSLVSSALILFGDKLFGASKGSKALNDSIDESAKKFANEAAELTTLFGLIKNTATATDDRNKALQAFNQEYGKYLKNLGIEKVDLGNINTAYEKIIDNLLKQAVIKGLQDEIAAAVEKTAKEMLKLQIAQEKEQASTKKVITEEDKLVQQKKTTTASIEQYKKATQDGFIAQARANQVLEAGVSQTASFEGRMKLLKDALTRELAPLLSLTTKFEDLGLVLDKTGSKTENIIEKAKRLADFFNKTTIRDISFEVNPTLSVKENEQRARDFITQVMDPIQRTLFRVKPELDIPAELRFTPNTTFIERSVASPVVTKTYDQLKKDFESQINARAQANPLVLQLAANVKIGQEFEARVQAAVDNINSILSGGLADIAGTFGEALGNALSGKFDTNIFDVLGNLVQQIGKALITYGFVKSGLDKIIKGGLKIPGAVAIALGAAAVALGALIKNSQRSIAGSRAGGGPVRAGQAYVVGEVGRELFIPNTAGRIVPNNQIGRGGVGNVSGGGMNLSGQFVISGSDLVLLFNRITRQQGRLT